jgi:hypothetical protein
MFDLGASKAHPSIGRRFIFAIVFHAIRRCSIRERETETNAESSMTSSLKPISIFAGVFAKTISPPHLHEMRKSVSSWDSRTRDKHPAPSGPWT